MKKLVTKIMVSCALLAILVAADTAYAQAPDGRDFPNAWDSAPATANDSWESGVAGKRVRVQPDDAIEDGRVVGKDPDPNIRSQLQREYHEGGDGD
jgi:beta-lactam-binding protein with PASTA domain